MKKRLSVAAVAAALALCTACADKPAPASSSAPLDPNTEPALLIPYTEKELVLPALQWSGGPQREDGTNSLWDAKTLAEAKVNLVSVYYRPMDADGKTLAGFWLPTEEMYQRTMDHAAADIALSDELGIRVMGYTDTVQFDDALMKEAYGYTLEDLAVKKADGSYAYTTAWDPKGCYVACINKPKWRALLADINALTAKAGFSCLMYDYYPYMAGGYFCHCSECESLWKAYSREKLGESKPMPAMFEFPDPVSIAYYKFRMESFASFMKETSAKAQALNPAFTVLQNHNLNSFDAPYQLLLGALKPPTTEFWGLDTGNESALYMPQLAEALGAEQLYAYYNAESQYNPTYRYKVNLAEFYAVTGGLMHQPNADNTAAGFFDFVSARRPVYAGSRSIAKTGVLYSWESSLFSMAYPNVDKGYYEFGDNLSRQAAAALVKAGVPSDFVALEREGAMARLDQYDVLVVPEYAYFVEETWKEPIRAFAGRGGRLIVSGGKAGAFIKELVSDIPDAKVSYIESFTGAVSEEYLTLPEPYTKALSDAGAYTQFRFTSPMEDLSATVRQNGSDLYLHIIRRGDPAGKENTGVSFTFTPPEGYEIGYVRAECPYGADKDVKIEWSRDEKGMVTAASEAFDTDLLVTLKPAKIAGLS